MPEWMIRQLAVVANMFDSAQVSASRWNFTACRKGRFGPLGWICFRSNRL